MSEFPFETFKESMKIIAEQMSSACMEDYIRARIKEVLAVDPTPVQLYDLMDWVSKRPCDRIGKLPNGASISVGDVDGFIQAICDVTKYYERPVETGNAVTET